MKIEGKDAVNIPLTKANVPAKSEIKQHEQIIQDMSQLSEIERLSLPISERAVLDAIEKANNLIDVASRKFEYAIHEKTHSIMIKVINTDTNEIIREIPPEKILDMVAKIWEMTGIILDERR